MTTATLLESGRIAIPGAVSFVAATGATWFVRSLARRFGIVNKPNPLVPQHTKPVAYLGGVGLGVGVAAGIVAMFIGWRADLDSIGLTLISLCVPAFLYLVLGMVDDLVAFQPAKKFMLQAAVAILAVVLGVWAPMTGVEAVDRGLSWFWIMTLVNAFNLTDVCDGLLGSLSAVMFGIVSLAYPPLAPMGVVLIAGCCGFLVFNKPPATIFLGDAGSHLLGFWAAALTLAGMKLPGVGPVTGSVAAVLMMGVPLSMPNTPTLVIVNVPPLISAGWVRPAFAVSTSSCRARARPTRSSASASLTFGTTRPRGVAAAMPRFT